MATKIKNIGLKLLGVWLIFEGLIQLFGLHFEGIRTVMAVLALAAGIFLLLEK